MGAAAAVCVAPFLIFLQAHGGIAEYVRTALVYARRDAARTSFSFPRFDLSQPLLAVAPQESPASAAQPYINVRWAPEVGAAERAGLERQYGLADPADRGSTTWTYRLEDTSRGNVERIVRDERVIDTHGIDRRTFTVAAPPASEARREVRTLLDAIPNAVAFLYYVLLALPFVAAALLVRLRHARGTRVMTSVPHLVPLLVVAAMVNVGFLSRGSTHIRLPDVGVTCGILAAWLAAALFSRSGRIVFPSALVRWPVRLCAAVLVVLSIWSVQVVGRTRRHLDEAGLTRSPAQVLDRAGLVWDELGVDPRRFYRSGQPEELRLTEYVNRCTEPTDRIFVLAEHPEIHYFADRRFAGGHAWLLPHYYSEDRDERKIVESLKRSRVPMVITEATSLYELEFRPEFNLVDAHLRAHYTDVGDVDIEEERPMRLWVRSDLEPVGVYPWRDLPCFAHGADSN
jgi:hypothetical protein